MARRVTCPSFVGREAELRRLEAVAEAAVDGSQIVVLGGDAGVGKTRLIDEVCTRWRARGGTAAVGGCVDLGDVGVGYGPLLEVLRHLRSDLGQPVLDALLRDCAPVLLPLLVGGHDGQQVRQDAVFAHTVALLEALGERYPGFIVVFEDVHWADTSTRDLVAFLARNLRTAKVTLLVSYRADDVHRRHPLRPLLVELTRSPTVEHVMLDGMSRSELTVLLTGVAGSVPSDAVVDEMMARSEGNPFYAEELQAASGGTEQLPSTLRETILVRVARLPERVQEVLRESAVLGLRVDDRLLAAATGRPAPDVGEALREAAAHQILVLEPDGCRFRHALVREALHDDLLPGERQRLHEAAATAIADRPELAGGADHVRWARLAHHWGAAQDQPNAFAASVRAGIAAERVGALADAAAHFQRAVDLWPRVPRPEEAAGMTRADLLVRAAGAVSHAGAPATAVTMVEAARKLLAPEAPPEARAIVLERLGHHRWVACDATGSLEARREAVALLDDRPPSEAQALALASLGRHQMLTDRYVEAVAALQRAMEVADAVKSQAARCSALSGLGYALVKLGRVDEGVEASWRSLRIAEEESDADATCRGYVNLTATLLIALRCEEAVAVATTGLEQARRAGMLATDGPLLAYGGAEALSLMGAWDEAEALLAAHAAGTDGPHGSTGAVVAARIAFWRGRHDDAACHRDRALTVTGGGRVSSEALVCAAQIAAREGRFDDARRRCADAWELVAVTDDLMLAAQTCSAALEVEADRIDAARGAARQREIDDARAVIDLTLDRFRHLRDRLLALGVTPLPDATAQIGVIEAEHGRAWGHPDPERWAAIADQWDALGFPYPAAMARYREADAVLRARGPRERAATAACAALAAADRLNAEPLAHQVHLLAQRGRLDLAGPEPADTPANNPWSDLGISRREAEVLELLAVGRTNRQIADELFISEKTASVHVTHLLRKLSVASRVEAAAIAQRLGMGA